MHTKDFLAGELRKAGLISMAEAAERGLYHDYLSPLAMPCVALTKHLLDIGTPEAMALRQRAVAGEFDASQAEAEAWADSQEGRETFAMLTRELWPRGARSEAKRFKPPKRRRR